MARSSTSFRLFAYGTLQRGGRYHQQLAAGYKSCQPATTWGRLYQLVQGYPMLVVPHQSILATGTLAPLDDIQHPLHFSRSSANDPLPPSTGNWLSITGELFEFDDAAARIPLLDELEGFTPNGTSMYDRVLLAVHAQGTKQSAWTYVAPAGKIPLDAQPWPHAQWP